ncbi:MAG: BREX system P-loop protein BrxC [Chloroflexi bacterium]|nr:BREX system P-loop protein BrxC [Chloroflexota bacterium]
MLLNEIFATKIQERIEPVVKVADRRPTVLLNELSSLVVTRQWEQYLRRILDAYTEAADREDEQGIGIWINGFFGSGKSLLMKVLGLLLSGGELEGQSVHQLFMERMAQESPERSSIQRYLTICQRKLNTTYVGGNLHAQQSNTDDPLVLIAFKLFATQRGFTHNWPMAWAVEYQIDQRGKSPDFHQRAEQLTGISWEDIAADPEFYLDDLYQAAAETLPDNFKEGATSVERSVASIQQSGITPTLLIDRFKRWCRARDEGGKRHKLLLQLDELGQWIAGGNANDRTMQIQALAEEAAQGGEGRIWLAITAHGDIQALKQNVEQEYYAKIEQRFALQCKLSNEDVKKVVEKRLLLKNQNGRVELERRFEQKSGELTDLGTLREPQRVYLGPDANSFALFYPYMPWTVEVIPDIVKGIAQAAGRDEALTGSNRTMIGVVQGGIIETSGLLESQVGRLLCLADLYDQLAGDAPIETKTDLNQVKDTVRGATNYATDGITTTRVARATYLLGRASYIPCSLENVVRALVDNLEVNLPSLRKRVKEELEKLVGAGYAKQVGDNYLFLSTQQRGFQDKVRREQERLLNQTYELSQSLKEYDSEAFFRFEQVPVTGTGRELLLKLEIDGRMARNPSASVTVRVYSPIQRAIDPQVADDNALRQRSAQDANNILFRLEAVQGLHSALALAIATRKIADEVIAAGPASGGELDVARKAKQEDLPSLMDEVKKLLAKAVKGGVIFFRGSTYQLAEGESAAQAVKSTLTQLLPSIYSRFADLPYRIVNEEKAVKAALHNNTTDPDLQGLGVFKADGTLNESNALISALRGRLPEDQYSGPVSTEALRSEFEKPPFGWDGNSVKVGLALLLRAATCRLIDNSQIIIDPHDPNALTLLTKEMKFHNLRVQGVKSELGMVELQQIRGFLEALFGEKVALVAATLSTKLGERLTETANTANEVHKWADTASCPLPLSFESGKSIVEELLSNSSHQARLPRFLEQADKLLGYVQLLEQLVEFRQIHSTAFKEMHNYSQNLIYAETGLPEVRRFITDYNTLTKERSITNLARWNEIVSAKRTAQQAMTNQTASWQSDARSKLSAIEGGLEQRVRQAGVPDESVAKEVEALKKMLTEVHQQLNQPDAGFYEARSLISKLTGSELNLQHKIAELKAIYKPKPIVQQKVHLKWGEFTTPSEIGSPEELNEVLGTLKERLLEKLKQHKDKVIVLE